MPFAYLQKHSMNSIINYDVFRGNFLSHVTLLLSRKNIYGRIDNRMPDFFRSKSLKQNVLKTTLRGSFRKRESKFCEKEASLTKTVITDISFLFASFLGLQFFVAQQSFGWRNCGSCQEIDTSLWKMPFSRRRLSAL